MPIDSPGAASQHLPWPSVTDAARRRRPLTFEPFRGLRYAPERVEDLAAVTAPPYDTLDRAGVAALRATDPHNIVRIILPRATKPTRRPERAAAHDAGYDEARDLLARWRGDGVLVVDPEPALYVYEQVDGRPENRGSPAGVLRGLIGAVELRDPDERVVLPHEDVLPGPVQDRLALMRVTRANLEPILLVYQGGGTTTEIVEAVSATPPMVEAHGPDGTSYRLWRISDPQRLATIAQDLAPRQSLIADGHHRYAAYLRLREEMHAAGAGNGPWDAGLALLVDQRAHPLGIAAIHRTVTGRTLRDVVDAASGVFQVEMFGADGAAARKALAGCAGVAHALIATDGSQWVLLRLPHDRAAAFQSTLPASRPLLDTDVLHGLLLGGPLRVAEEAISYVHDERAVIDAVRDGGGVAFVLNPVDVATVWTVAGEGGRMPRKSTSFGPKPRTGFVMRAFDDQTTRSPGPNRPAWG
jgi:uncharacterized protein (DUF1015 family)